MYHVDVDTAVASMPAVKPVISKQRRFHTNGNPTMGIPAAILDADFLNIIQEELLGVTDAAGIEPDKLDNKQLLKALRWMIAKSLGREEWDESSTAAAPSIPLWKPDFDYTLPYIVWGSDNELYTAEKPSGPGTRVNGAIVGPMDPTKTTDFWRSYRAQVSGDAGDIKLFSCRPAFLKKPWVFCNGDVYLHESPYGKALHALPETMKSDLRIIADATGINVPDLFFGGRGCFLRAVDGNSRLPGSIEQDAARPVAVNPTSGRGTFDTMQSANPTGLFSRQTTYMSVGYQGGYPWDRVLLDMSNLSLIQENQGDENRPLNFGMTPAICLPGV